MSTHVAKAPPPTNLPCQKYWTSLRSECKKCKDKMKCPMYLTYWKKHQKLMRWKRQQKIFTKILSASRFEKEIHAALSSSKKSQKPTFGQIQTWIDFEITFFSSVLDLGEWPLTTSFAPGNGHIFDLFFADDTFLLPNFPHSKSCDHKGNREDFHRSQKKTRLDFFGIRKSASNHRNSISRFHPAWLLKRKNDNKKYSRHSEIL